MSSTENWAKNIVFTPRRIIEPGSANPSTASASARIAELDRRVDVIAAGVVQAVSEGRHVRALGSIWSFSNVVTAADVMVNTAELSQVIDTTASSGPLSVALGAHGEFAYVEAGAQLHALFLTLEAAGLMVSTAGSSSGQTIAGVMSTSTHGADFQLPPLPDYVRALLLVSPTGERLWLEPASRPLTADDTKALSLCKNATVHRDDALFEAALVAVGTMGVVCALVLEVEPLYGLSEKVTHTGWNQVRSTLSESSPTAFATPPPGTQHPAPGTGTAEYGFLEVLLNPYRTSDDYSANGNDDRSVLLVTREKAPAFIGTPWTRSKPTTLDALRALITITSGSVPQYRVEIDKLISGGRQDSGGFHPAQCVFDFGDTRNNKVWSVEACIRTLNDDHLEFIDAVLARFDALFGQGRRLAGFFSLRFTQGTTTSLGMQNGTTGASGRYCHVEFAALQHPVHMIAWDPTRLAAESEAFMQAFWEEARARADGRVMLHWGQMGREPEDFFVRAARLPKLSSFYGKMRQVAGDQPNTCTNDFCMRAGVTPPDAGWILIASAVPSAPSRSPIDCSNLARTAPVALGDDVFVVQGDAFVAVSNRLNAWSLCRTAGETIDSGDFIVGAIAVARNDDGRPEIFARAADRRCYHRWLGSSALGHTPSWSGWTDLDGGERFDDDPAAALDGSGLLHVAAIDDTGTVQTRRQQSISGWTGWQALGALPGGAKGRPAIVRRADDKLVLFVRDGSGKLWGSVRDSSWSAFSDTGVRTDGDPAAAANPSGVLLTAPKVGGGLEASFITSAMSQSGVSSVGAVRARPGTRIAACSVGTKFVVALTDPDGTFAPFLHSGQGGWLASPASVVAHAISGPSMQAMSANQVRVYTKVAHDLVQTLVLSV